MQSYIRPHRWSIVAPGHHGESRTGGQSLISGLEAELAATPPAALRGEEMRRIVVAADASFVSGQAIAMNGAEFPY